MKKLALLLVLTLLLGTLGGCFGQREALSTPDEPDFTTQPPETRESTEPSTDTQPTQPEEATEPSTEKPTEPPTQPPTEKPTEPPTQPPTEKPTEPPVEPTPAPDARVVQYADMKAMWLSQYDLTGIYLNGGVQRDQADYTNRMAQVLDNVQAQGFNTVILQVRPNADSMYPSQYYPMSAYVVGKTGEKASYDPVAILVRLAHERNLSIHAWINPMRGMTEAEMKQVGQEFPMRQWYDDDQTRGKYIVSVSGRWYLNPAYAPVRQLIVAGAGELLNNYDFDGLHMDDYFYPTTDASFDAAAYGEYQSAGGKLSLADFRRENLNKLVHQLYSLTRDSRSGRIFGISPAGNLDTVYNQQYADVYRWCAEAGYIDYICPQVYFGLEHSSYDFVKVSRQYQSLIQVDGVDLIVGMTFGKAFSQEDKWAGNGKNEWKDNKDVLARCLQTTRDLPKCRGVAVFCYQYFFDPVSGKSVAETEQERGNFVPVFQEIGWN